MSKIIENTVYSKKNYISNIKMWVISDNSNATFLYMYILSFWWFVFILYNEVQDFNLLLKIPFLWIWFVIFLIWWWFLLKGKTTLKWVKPIYEIINDFFVIVKDNSMKKYNQKTYTSYNELKEINVEL